MRDYIHKRAEELLRQADCRDPFALAEHLGIICMERSDFSHLKGMYFSMCKQRFIVLNANLSERMKRLVMAHELGHDLLHRQLAREKAFQEYELFPRFERTEYEANLAAACILLPDETVYERVKEGMSVSQIAAVLDTEADLLLLKLQDMAGRGYALRLSDYGRSDFLRN